MYCLNKCGYPLRRLGAAKGLPFKTIKDGIYFNSKKYFSVASKDDITFESDSKYICKAKKYIFGDNENEKAILGNTFKDNIIKPLLQEIIKFKCVTAFGPAPLAPDNIANIQSIILKLDTMLSKKIFLE